MSYISTRQRSRKLLYLIEHSEVVLEAKIKLYLYLVTELVIQENPCHYLDTCIWQHPQHQDLRNNINSNKYIEDLPLSVS